VCDKGVGAALFMALFRTLIRVTTAGGDGKAGEPGGEVLARALRVTNDYIATTHGDANMFATLFLGLVDTASGELTYVNAGHEMPLIVGPHGAPRQLAGTGPAVGMMPGMAFGVATAELAAGESLVVFTDGVTEARAPDGSLYGEERLAASIGAGGASAEGAVGLVLDELRRHGDGTPPADDVSLLVLRRRE
jgi:phosphoserine phosphatase RsbU/P